MNYGLQVKNENKHFKCENHSVTVSRKCEDEQFNYKTIKAVVFNAVYQ